MYLNCHCFGVLHLQFLLACATKNVVLRIVIRYFVEEHYVPKLALVRLVPYSRPSAYCGSLKYCDVTKP